MWSENITRADIGSENIKLLGGISDCHGNTAMASVSRDRADQSQAMTKLEASSGPAVLKRTEVYKLRLISCL